MCIKRCICMYACMLCKSYMDIKPRVGIQVNPSAAGRDWQLIYFWKWILCNSKLTKVINLSLKSQVFYKQLHKSGTCKKNPDHMSKTSTEKVVDVRYEMSRIRCYVLLTDGIVVIGVENSFIGVIGLMHCIVPDCTRQVSVVVFVLVLVFEVVLRCRIVVRRCRG